MKKLCTVLVCCVAFSAFLSVGRVNTATAHPTFAKAFELKYIGDGKTDSEKSLAAEVKRVKKCTVCHDTRKDESGKMKKKTFRNPYGTALSEFLTKDLKSKEHQEKVIELLSKAEGKKADGSEKTFGELIKSGKVPFEYKEAK
jgi:hypothetical protein